MIKQDAIVKIEMGAGFIERLQQLLFFLVASVTPEELEEYKKLLESKEELTEPWMEHITTLAVLIKEFEEKANQQGFTYDGDLPSITPQES